MKHVILILTLIVNSISYSQDLVVSLTNSTTESFSIAEIESIMYGPGTLILNELNGTSTTWNIVDVNNFSFELLSTENQNLTNNQFLIYPNPASNLVNIQFKAEPLANLKIDIYDSTGKHIKQVFDGIQGETKIFQWNINVGSGFYYCKIETDKKIISKPIIIK